LRQAGWDPIVIERAATPRELGFALLLAPNAMAALRQLGVADAVREGGAVVRSGEMRRPNGTVLRRFDAAAAARLLGEDAYCILRPVLHGRLLDAVGTDALRLGRAVTGFRREGDEVVVEGESGLVERARLLVGADGVGSMIRRQLHPGEPPAHPSGLFAFRGVAQDAVRHLEGVSGTQYFGRGIEAGIAQASARAVYWYLSVRADHVERYGGPSDPLSVLQQVIAPFHAPFRALVDATKPEDLRFELLLIRDPLPSWGDGPTTLLGDAAHPMLPHAGQGAAQALEDAVALGRRVTPDQPVASRLRDYERVRQPRTMAIAAVAQRNARMGSVDGALACTARDMVLRLIPQRVILKALVAMGKPPEAD
jgi:2-polyprenyl-6-methoxyphenol hydroxylase-like FAD-dependent oxidoreductase